MFRFELSGWFLFASVLMIICMGYCPGEMALIVPMSR